MLFTRRHLDRAHIVLAAMLLAAVGGLASCASSEDNAERSEGSIDGGPDTQDAEAGIDAATPRDAGWSDAAPPPVVCATPPCATALVTTRGARPDDLDEGFCALLDDGTVACWGSNQVGQLGRGEEAERAGSSTPERVVGVSNVVELDHTCAVDKSGGVWCWGTGPFLRGDGGARTIERTPVKLDLPASTKVGLGYDVACAVVEGGLRCWGSNADGQLGPLGSAEDGQSKLMKLPDGAPVRSLGVGRATFVLREDGELLTWGANPPIGRMSSIFPDPYPAAVEIAGVSSIDLVYDDACATAGGYGFCWGAPTHWKHKSAIGRALPEALASSEPFVQISTTRTHTFDWDDVQGTRWCAVAASGALYCWGLNTNGQAGDGTQEFAIRPSLVKGLPTEVAAVRTTRDTTCALLTSGKVYCWGGNYYGQLGNGQIRGRSLVPVEVVLP